MPELPEVENVRQSLAQLIIGKKIIEAEVGWPNIVKHPLELQQFCDALAGQTVQAIDRIGKFLIFELDDYALVSHLRMEGHYSLHDIENPIEKHTHVFFRFDDDTELRYRDVRKFGTMHLFSKGTEREMLPLSKLGPEPFSESFTEDYFLEKLSKTSRIIKAVLLDQTVVTGLGNIYVDEVLFRAKLHPERRASSLLPQEAVELHKQIINVLREAVLAGGSSVNTYMNSLGIRGSFQEQLHVYGRNGKECPDCGSILEKIKAAGRGTHYCPECQKNEEKQQTGQL